MDRERVWLLALELERRVEELRKEYGDWLDFEIDAAEWTCPEYAHQN